MWRIRSVQDASPECKMGQKITKVRDLLLVFDRSLRSLLDGEMEHSAGLRQETDLLKRKLAELEERHTAKVQALAR